jgi:hypothetical protein
MKNTINLTRVEGCYSKELREAAPTIAYMLKEKRVSFEEMQQTVLGIVEQATINAGAKKRFIENLMSCVDKYEIDKLCYDAVKHGMYYHPKNRVAV